MKRRSIFYFFVIVSVTLSYDQLLCKILLIILDIEEDIASISAPQTELGATSVITTNTASGDCTPNFGPNKYFLCLTGAMTSGDSQGCTLINPIIINDGEVPDAPTR